MDREEILQTTINHYLASNDFNGWSTSQIGSPQEVEAIVGLIEDGLVDIITPADDENVHIKRHSPCSPEMQIRRVRLLDCLAQGCLYPTAKALHLNGVVYDIQRPYTSALREGSAQLDFRVFRLEVLEQYRNDPRYYYEVNDIYGTVYRTGVNIDDDESIQFGFAYDVDINRYVAVFLRYLHRLYPRPQQMWHHYEVDGDFKLHPDYYRRCVLGMPTERISIFDAFLEEKRIINKMSIRMGKPEFFRSDCEEYRRPTGFSFLIRPTSAEFSAFCLLLDQLLSDDMNRDFFRGDIEMEERGYTEDGRSMVQPKGTISLLKEWISKNFHTDDISFNDDLMAGFRMVRNARQKPAHKATKNVFDETYYQKQRELILAAYRSVQTLRMCFSCHPACWDVEVPRWILEERLWTR